MLFETTGAEWLLPRIFQVWGALLMAEEKKDDGMVRRQFLRCGLTGTLTAAAALAVRPARAQDFPKMTQDQAGYQNSSTSQTCASCTLFIPPTDCKIVQGPVSESGTCTYFTQ
jgi:hypothetical protein